MLKNTGFASYIDDTTPYVFGDGAKEVIDCLKCVRIIILLVC